MRANQDASHRPLGVATTYLIEISPNFRYAAINGSIEKSERCWTSTSAGACDSISVDLMVIRLSLHEVMREFSNSNLLKSHQFSTQKFSFPFIFCRRPGILSSIQWKCCPLPSEKEPLLRETSLPFRPLSIDIGIRAESISLRSFARNGTGGNRMVGSKEMACRELLLTFNRKGLITLCFPLKPYM